jgi:hypothetical protein
MLPQRGENDLLQAETLIFKDLAEIRLMLLDSSQSREREAVDEFGFHNFKACR